MTKDVLLEVSDLSVLYGEREVLHRIDLILKQGEILAIVGESGSGKSTLLKAVQGLWGKSGIIQRGCITFRGKDITHCPPNERNKMAGVEMSMIFQDAGDSFCPIRTIGDQIYECVRAHKPWDRQEFLDKAAALMKEFGLPDSVLNSYPFQLSGGMSQRAGILAAMILEPSILFADEPTSALDTITQGKVVKELMRLRNRRGVSMLLVTHHMGVAYCMADQILIMKEGNCVEYGTKEEIFYHPKTSYTKELLASVPRIS